MRNLSITFSQKQEKGTFRCPFCLAATAVVTAVVIVVGAAGVAAAAAEQEDQDDDPPAAVVTVTTKETVTHRKYLHKGIFWRLCRSFHGIPPCKKCAVSPYQISVYRTFVAINNVEL